MVFLSRNIKFKLQHLITLFQEIGSVTARECDERSTIHTAGWAASFPVCYSFVLQV